MIQGMIFAFMEIIVTDVSTASRPHATFSTRQLPEGGFQIRPYEPNSFLRPLRSLRSILRIRIFYSVISVASVVKSYPRNP